MTNIDEKLSQFIDFTGCPSETARDILEGCQWDVQKATNFYFGIESNDTPLKTPPKTPPQTTNLLNKKTPSPKPPMSNINKQLNLSPLTIHTEPKEKHDKLILSGSHEKFNEYRLDAQDKNRWLLILLTNKPLNISILKQVDLRDFTNTRYVPLEINREESDGQWFSNAYNVKTFPFYAILDPVTTELLDKHEGEMTSLQRQLFLKEFLNKHPEKGRSIDFEMTDLYNYTLGSTSEASSSESDSDVQTGQSQNDENKEDESIDPGPIVKVMIQLENNKRTKIEIGENEKIRSLYKKVASLMKKNMESFKLVVPYPTMELTDMSQTIQEAKLKNSMVHVEDIA